MCCFKLSIHTLRLSVGGRMDGRTDGRTDGRKIFTQYSGISSCSQGSTDNTPRRASRDLNLSGCSSIIMCVENKNRRGL
jgi:hypothetical protein